MSNNVVEAIPGLEFNLEFIRFPKKKGEVQILVLASEDGDSLEVPVTELRGFGQPTFSLGNRYQRCEDGVLRCIK